MTMDADGITHLPSFRCPRCGYQADAVGELRGTPVPPSAGDISACLACGCPMTFVDAFGTGALQLRPLTDDELAALPEAQRRDLAQIRSFADKVMRPHRAAKAAKLN